MLALALAKRVSELHGFSYQVRHLKGWESCTSSFPDFVAETQNPFVLDSKYEEFTIHFVDGIKMKYSSVISEHLESTCLGPKSIILHVLTFLFQQIKGRNGCPRSLFHFGLVIEYAYAVGLPPMKTVKS